jgi:hypothetical protein
MLFPSIRNGLTLAIWLLAGYVASATAGIWRPPTMYQDSLALRTERGVELTRQTEHLCWTETARDLTDLQAVASWKTEWIGRTGHVERRRQDGRWYLSGLHPWKPWLAFWLATQGEFFDERAPGSSKIASPPLKSFPAKWELQTPSIVSSSVSPTTIRILRGGGGLRLQPLSHTELVTAAGVLEDRRFGLATSGPLWETGAQVVDWDISGYVQDLNLQAESETPGAQHNRDLQGRYEVQREFSPGTSNDAEVSASEIHHSYFLDAAGRLANREERNTHFADQLTYAIRPDLGFNLSGELGNMKTEISQGDRKSSLEESRANFNASLMRRANRFSGTAGIGMQSMTQTIDGDILQGRQTNLRLDAGFQPSAQDSFYAGVQVSKYQLDTRDPHNYDDRDELRYAFALGGLGIVNSHLSCEASARVTLDHLVYLFKQRSANNLWTRLFVVDTKLHHYPLSWLRQTFGFEISANYQAFDYEFDPRQIRSTVFRRLELSDSLAVEWTRALSTVVRVTLQREELGRLFWHEFQEERSDEITTIYSSLDFPWQIGPATWLMLGGLYNYRRGVRFPTADFEEKEVFQNLQTYGPSWGLHHEIGTCFVANGKGQIVRQLELEQEDRWLVMGEIGVTFRW